MRPRPSTVTQAPKELPCVRVRATILPRASALLRWTVPVWKRGSVSNENPTATSGVWTISKPLPYDVHLAGSGTMVVNVTTQLPNANLAVDVYDLDGNGSGPLITRQAHLVRTPGDFGT